MSYMEEEIAIPVNTNPNSNNSNPINNRWTEKKINKLLYDAEMSKFHSLCHTRAYEHYKRSFQRTTMIIALLGAAVTILEGTNILLEEKYIGIGVAVLVSSALSSFLAQRINSNDPSALAAAHQDMSKGYNRIIMQIESELVNDPDEREPGTDFLKTITKSLIDLTTGGQICPTNIFNQVQKEVDTGDIDPSKYWGQNQETEDVRHAVTETVVDQEHHIVDMSGNVIPVEGHSPSIIVDLDQPRPNTSGISTDASASVSTDPSNNEVLPSVEIRLNPNIRNANRLNSQYQANRFRFG